MQYKKIYPADVIKHIVCFFWEFEGSFTALEPYAHGLTASVNPKLAFQYNGLMHVRHDNYASPLFQSGFQCQTSAHLAISATQPVGIFGTYFYPYAIPLLFGVPAHALTNYNIEISDVLGIEGVELAERMMTCRDTAERVATMTSFLTNKLSKRPDSQKDMIATFNYITAHSGKVDINELVNRNFLSQRQFERKFKAWIGFPAKLFTRIVRFEACLANALAGSESLVRLSLDSGYYDQSHMIRDFKEFSGTHPRGYLTENRSSFFE